MINKEYFAPPIYFFSLLIISKCCVIIWRKRDILRHQRLLKLNIWHSTENVSSTHPLTSGVRYSNHAYMLVVDILNTRCESLKIIYVEIW